jgi:hypothetical protein
MKIRLAVALVTMLGAAAPIAAQATPPAPPASQPPASELVIEAVLARNVVDRMPVDSGTTFPADVGQVVLWMRASGADGQALSHVWFLGDRELGNVPLNIGGSPWRSWTKKTITPEMTGPWHVEIRDAAGAVLKRIDFVVGG